MKDRAFQRNPHIQPETEEALYLFRNLTVCSDNVFFVHVKFMMFGDTTLDMFSALLCSSVYGCFMLLYTIEKILFELCSLVIKITFCT